jgi:hypothetical protein
MGDRQVAGHPQRAIRLLATACSLLETRGSGWLHAYVPRVPDDDAVLAAVRSRMGDTAFEHAQAWGRSIGSTRASQYALEQGRPGLPSHKAGRRQAAPAPSARCRNGSHDAQKLPSGLHTSQDLTKPMPFTGSGGRCRPQRQPGTRTADTRAVTGAVTIALSRADSIRPHGRPGSTPLSVMSPALANAPIRRISSLPMLVQPAVTDGPMPGLSNSGSRTRDAAAGPGGTSCTQRL